MHRAFPIIKGRKIKMAIIGCGRVSKNHFNSIEKHQNNIKLVSICDNQKEILNKYKLKFKVKGYFDLEDMLKNENLDLVALCTLVVFMQFKQKLCAKTRCECYD